jgi:HptB-dependent secretion and biofilm anti anti-sigma factor
MDIVKNLNHGTYDVTLNGKFTFSDHQAFREILDKIAEKDVQQIVLHMSGVEFVDSAALGMLLLALDESEKHQKRLAINGPTGQVKKMFDMARFNTLFSIN